MARIMRAIIIPILLFEFCASPTKSEDIPGDSSLIGWWYAVSINEEIDSVKNNDTMHIKDTLILASPVIIYYQLKADSLINHYNSGNICYSRYAKKVIEKRDSVWYIDTFQTSISESYQIIKPDGTDSLVTKTVTGKELSCFKPQNHQAIKSSKIIIKSSTSTDFLIRNRTEQLEMYQDTIIPSNWPSPCHI
jgi:hypothetical protein